MTPGNITPDNLTPGNITTARKKRPRNGTARSGKPWTGADISRLIVMAERQVPAKRIAAKLRRSEGAVRAEAARQRVLLAPSGGGPTVKRPYGGLTVDAAAAARHRRAHAPSRARAKSPTRESHEDPQATLF